MVRIIENHQVDKMDPEDGKKFLQFMLNGRRSGDDIFKVGGKAKVFPAVKQNLIDQWKVKIAQEQTVGDGLNQIRIVRK